MKRDELTVKEKRFVEVYLGEANGNATEAARIAGYSAKSDATLRVIAHEVKTKPNVRARIDEILTAESLSAAEVIHELTRLATAPTSHFMQVTGYDEEAGALQVRQDYGAKTKALELLGKHHRLFVDKTEVAGVNGGPLVIEVEYVQARPATPALEP